MLIDNLHIYLHLNPSYHHEYHKEDLTLLVDHDYLEHNKGDHKDDLTLLVDPPGVCQLVHRLPALHEEAVPQFVLVPRGSTP